jgi:hypothetical protein
MSVVLTYNVHVSVFFFKFKLDAMKRLKRVRVLVFNATFNNISVISWRSVLLVEETGENHRPAASY